MKCPYCNSENTKKAGKSTSGKQKNFCRDWRKHLPDQPKSWTTELKNGGRPKILIFDIETSTVRAWVWRTGKQFVGPKQVLQESFILSWSAKWLFESKVIHDRVTGEEAIARDDKRVVEHLWRMMDSANIIIAHNLNNFDRKKANARFLKHRLFHPSPYQTIDTLAIARREFQIESNSLDYLCKYLGLPRKMDTDYELWLDCENGDEKALKKMDRYCRHDTRILEDVYLELRPYMHSHPNIGLYLGNDSVKCTNCGSDKLTPTKDYVTPANKYPSYRCECGAITRIRAGSLNAFDRVEGRSVAR